MKNKFISLFFIGAMILISTSGLTDTFSSGAPVGSTGAEGELTCGKAGCHIGNNETNNINTGKGVFSITCENNIQQYIPGKTYEITVVLKEKNIERFGFSLTALDEHHRKAGTLIVSDEQRTQIFEGARQFADRTYITYRMAGTKPYKSGKGLWKFKWQAPEQPIGEITFYAAGISANNDATDKGDLVYTQTLTLKSKSLNNN
jgi:hypothetical protein